MDLPGLSSFLGGGGGGSLPNLTGGTAVAGTVTFAPVNVGSASNAKTYAIVAGIVALVIAAIYLFKK